MSVKMMSLGFPGGTRGKEPPVNARDVRDVGLIPGSQEDPLEEGMTTHSSILPWKHHGQRSLVGYSPPCRKESEHD